MRKKKGKLAQVWIETVIYTLIAMIMIGAVLAWGRPKIEELQDKSIIEQTIGVFEDIDAQISSVIEGGAGNKRFVEIGLKKGSIEIDSENDLIYFEIETRYTYSEPGQDVFIGKVLARTVNKGEYNTITIMNDYREVYDLKFDGGDIKKTITRSSTPYNFLVSYQGQKNEETNLPVIDLSLS